MKTKWLASGIIFLLVGTVIIPSTAQKINETDTSSLFDGKPDLTIVGIVGEYYLEGATLKCVVKNIGTAPTEDNWLDTDGFIFFGLVHVWDSYNLGGYSINPGETENIECGCPYPYIGIIRLRCTIGTSTPEENNNNNRFVHSYILVNRDPFWVFKELP